AKLDRDVEIGVEHHTAVRVQKPPPVPFLEVPATYRLRAVIADEFHCERNLLPARLGDPCPRLVDDAKDAVAHGRCSIKTVRKWPSLVEERIDGQIALAVNESNLAVEHHARQLADQPIRLLEFRLHEPAPVGALQPPKVVPPSPAHRGIILVEVARLGPLP